MQVIIADTGFVVAVVSKLDDSHAACVAIYTQFAEILLPQTVLAEVAYLIERESGSVAVAKFLMGIEKSRMRLIPITDDDVYRTAEILTQYADSRIDFVDATVMAVAERLQIEQVLTLDRRDFQIFRPKHCSSFTLLP